MLYYAKSDINIVVNGETRAPFKRGTPFRVEEVKDESVRLVTAYDVHVEVSKRLLAQLFVSAYTPMTEVKHVSFVL